MNEWFSHALLINGDVTSGERITPAVAQKLRGKLPTGLIELWQEHGPGMWANGKFQFCLPDQYHPIIKMIFDGDAQFEPAKTHLFGFGAFGELTLWNEASQNLRINLPYLRGYADCIEPDWRPVDPSAGIVASIMQVNETDQFTLFDDTPEAAPLFEKCIKRLGRLEPGECFGLFPALALGGSTNLNSVRRVKALEHFAILAQLGPVRLVDYSTGAARFLRNLGSQG